MPGIIHVQSTSRSKEGNKQGLSLPKELSPAHVVSPQEASPLYTWKLILLTTFLDVISQASRREEQSSSIAAEKTNPQMPQQKWQGRNLLCSYPSPIPHEDKLFSPHAHSLSAQDQEFIMLTLNHQDKTCSIWLPLEKRT